jgi:hypothetical protein
MERYDTRVPNKTSIYQHTILQIDTTCVKDTCLRIPLAAAEYPRSRCLENFPTTHSLCDDR